MDNRDYEEALDKCWNKFCESKPTLSKQAGVLTLFNFIFNYLYPINKHNLTSDAEGEEMLTVSRKRVQEIYAKWKKIKTNDNPNITDDIVDMADHNMSLLFFLFGTKCWLDKVRDDIKDEVQEQKPFKPKFKVGDLVKVNGNGITKIGKIQDIAFNNKYAIYWVSVSLGCFLESDLEPYTEPKKEGKEGKTGKKLENPQSDQIANCDKEFDNILKDSFSKERRLNIAAMATLGILSNESRMKRYEGMAATEPRENLTEIVARNAMRYADALIAECDKYISVEKLKHILRALVADGAIEPITMSVDEIINKIKKSI